MENGSDLVSSRKTTPPPAHRLQAGTAPSSACVGGSFTGPFLPPTPCPGSSTEPLQSLKALTSHTPSAPEPSRIPSQELLSHSRLSALPEQGCVGLPSLVSGACHVKAAPSVFVESIRTGGCAVLREAAVPKTSLFQPELPGFHNLALLQGDLGTSSRSHGYGFGLATGWVRHG